MVWRNVAVPCCPACVLQVNLETGGVQSEANVTDVHDALHMNWMRVRSPARALTRSFACQISSHMLMKVKHLEAHCDASRTAVSLSGALCSLWPAVQAAAAVQAIVCKDCLRQI